jgi:hypothetical protein
MNSGSKSLVSVKVGLILISTLAWDATAKADGGTLRAWKRQGGYEIAVFTEPTPLVTGPVDMSVLLLDGNTGEPIRDAHISMEIRTLGRVTQSIRSTATSRAATNKLLQAAVLELREAGRYEVNIGIDGANGNAELRFDLLVGTVWPTSTGIWPWILCPVAVIGLYGIHLCLVHRSTERKRGE